MTTQALKRLVFARQFYTKPTKQRQERYNRWVRRRSTDKIKNLLANINYELAK